MKVYEAIFKEDQNKGVYALSVVENPAMEDMWIALNEHPKKIELAQVDEEKRLLLGAALIPNKRIYRNIEGNEFEMFFTEETIEKLAHSFMKNQNNNNSSLEHQIKLEGMSVVEAWTVNDPSTDKSASYGKQYPKGTWVTMMKVENDEVWTKVKNGEIKGFSIDALLSLQEIKLNTNIINMNEEVKKGIVSEILEGVKALFSTKEETTEVEKIEVHPEEVIEEVKDEFNKDDFMAEVIETVKTKFSVQAKQELDAVKLELTNQIQELTKERDALQIELNKQPVAETIKPQLEGVSVELSQKELRNMSIAERAFAAVSNN